MPLIDVTQSQYVSDTIRLELAAATLVDRYAAFVHGSADEVVDRRSTTSSPRTANFRII